VILHQVYVAIAIGFVGLAYCLTYETLVTTRGFERHGAEWLISHNRRRTIHLLGYTMLWPAMEEAVVRGVPMLITSNRLLLTCILVGMNVAFMAAHRDRDIMATNKPDASFVQKHRWELRFDSGLLFLIPAVVFYNLYGCIALHAAWNLQAAIARLRGNRYALRDGRIIVLSVRPFELLVDPDAKPGLNMRKLLRHMRTIRYSNPNPTA
jgi:hypothetical protein